jgi:hypothetical protein
MGPISPQIIRDQPFIARRKTPDISPRKEIDHLLGRELFKSATP